MSVSHVIGIDPDSEAHGFALYKDGRLVEMERKTTIQIVDMLIGYDETGGNVLFSIEDVMRNQFIYGRNEQKNKFMQGKVGMHVGRCQQAQVELIRWLEHYNIPYQLHKPQSGNWAKNKDLFEKATGWSLRSNEDCRSAAYFGMLAVKKLAPAKSK